MAVEKPSCFSPIIKSEAFAVGMMAVIVVNSVCVLLEDDSQMKTSVGWLVADCTFTSIFVMELGRGDDLFGNPHRAQTSQFEQFEPTVSQSAVSLPPS